MSINLPLRSAKAGPMIRLSIKGKIIGIAVGLIILMAIASVLSMAMVNRVSERLQELTEHYIPAYGNLARANIRSLERALALRRILIEKLQRGPEGRVESDKHQFAIKGADVEREMQAARALIAGLIDKGTSFGDAIRLARMETQVETVLEDNRRYLNAEINRLLSDIDSGDSRAVADGLNRVDKLRDELNEKIDRIRSDMLSLVQADSATTLRDQHRVFIIALTLIALSAMLGLIFSALVSSGVTRPVRRLLEGTRAIEAGRLDQTIRVTSRDEIGHLTVAFNHMVEQLRLKERIRETFGKYIDPRVVEGLIDRPVLADGQRRVMTVLFCDMKGFTTISESTTPQALIKVMNRYLSLMSEPIHQHRGIIDKYIGDAIMAYWGPPFTNDADQARLACLAALDMAKRAAILQSELPDLLGMRSVPFKVDVRIGIATGQVLVGSIGSELMMSYTVLGDTVNLAARLESANKLYGTRLLASEPTIMAAAVEAREIDTVVVLGQSEPQTIFEIMGEPGELTSEQISLKSKFAEGLSAYRERRWAEARSAFAAAAEVAPADGPSTTFLKRLEGFEKVPPAADWDGYWRLADK